MFHERCIERHVHSKKIGLAAKEEIHCHGCGESNTSDWNCTFEKLIQDAYARLKTSVYHDSIVCCAGVYYPPGHGGLSDIEAENCKTAL